MPVLNLGKLKTNTMQREILFRGKRVDNGEWSFGGYMHAKSDTFDNHLICKFLAPDCQGWDYGQQTFFFEVDPATVGQFTGLLDKNGVKIFEGDVVKTETTPDRVWGKDEYIFDVAFVRSGWKFKSKVGLINVYDNKFRNHEVIGNIHDNPELLS